MMGGMALLREQAEMLELLEAKVVGRTIRDFEVLGINALKTFEPPVAAACGDEVVGVSFDPTGRLRISCRHLTIQIDFARTGGLEYSAALTKWRPAGKAIPPTGRLLLADGDGIDFKEPARTKRITFALEAN
jgi:formamidopyrimidine-DNA glycosylase